jgi:3'-phosphoadenosine 5'-phosphosulfate sulfotransferase (PAPS reductase)/FAD synthetase
MTALAPEPARNTRVLRLLSLGAGVQSTAVLLLACERVIPPFDHALFADTGWEPRAVYETLSRLRERAAQAGFPIRMVSAGNIRTDALNGTRRFVAHQVTSSTRTGRKASPAGNAPQSTRSNR